MIQITDNKDIVTSDARAWLSDVTLRFLDFLVVSNSYFKCFDWLNYLLFAAVLAYCFLGTLSPVMQELGCAMPHSDFLTWLSSAVTMQTKAPTPKYVISKL